MNTETMQKEFRGEATYCPEDNKLRLYVGRVPREEFLKLRADGWTTLHKQREAGGGDFVATWTPSRRDTALEYAGVILDEDMGPAERAADRAERFSGYRDKRSAEACGHADRYKTQPAAHGFQSADKAERAAAKHDRIGDRATDAWSKAEYWQQRTAGVISHALYKSAPGVRMGRIKELEAELRRQRADIEKRTERFTTWQRIAAMDDAEKQNHLARRLADYEHGDYKNPVTGAEQSLYRIAETDGVTGKQIAELWLAGRSMPAQENDWTIHLTLRLAYENQMLQAQGGRLEQFEVLPGGKLGGKLIYKVNKSSVTKRATSVSVIGPRVSGWAYRVSNIPHTEFAEYQIELERISPDAYTPPTDETLAELKKQIKAAQPAKAPCPLINPTDADAERLQALWNERAKAEHEARNEYTSESARAMHSAQFKPSTVCRITQAVYSANSKGSYSSAETRGLRADGFRARRASNMYSQGGNDYDKRTGKDVCTLRITSGDGEPSMTKAPRVIILTDKPQKPLPAAVWEKYVAPVAETEAAELATA